MWLMLQYERPDDYIVATGESHSVRDFVELAFAAAGLDWRRHVEVDPRYFRPTEVDSLLGDPSKARAKLGWRHKTTFNALVAEMVEADRRTVREERERRNRRD
jgi:GDPmannose 4,6-dehydratase